MDKMEKAAWGTDRLSNYCANTLSDEPLPSDPDDQRKFAIRLGYQEFDAFRSDYLDARNAIQTLYQRHIKPA